MISDSYRELNEQLHRKQPKYGTGGKKWAKTIIELVHAHQLRSVLDYGCGKGTLRAALEAHYSPIIGQPTVPGKPAIAEYDPCVPGKDARPVPADLVVCTDVMEHVEAQHVAAVIDDVLRLALRAALISVCIEVGTRKLPDGRPAHITVRPADWWDVVFTTSAHIHDMRRALLPITRADTRTWLFSRSQLA